MLQDAPAPADSWWERAQSSFESTKVSIGSAISTPITSFVHNQINPAFEWLADAWVRPASNVLYAMGMLYLFTELPKQMALLFGLGTILIGPALIEALLELLWLLLETVATDPVYIVVGAWSVLLINSAIVRRYIGPWLSRRFQEFAMWLELDSDGTGRVDWLDVVHYLQYKTAAGQWLTEHVSSKVFDGDVHSYFQLRREKQKAKGVEARLARIEAMLEALLAKEGLGGEPVAYLSLSAGAPKA